MLAILIWLLCVGISAILIGYFIRYLNTPTPNSIHKKEGFVTISCPIGTTSFVTREGETQCCNGEIVDNFCNGNVRCSLSPNSISGIPSCSDYVAARQIANSAALCPPAIPNYFASTDGSLRGCSVSQPTADGSAPLDPNQLQCILYPTLDLEKVRLDSCYNYNLNLTASAKCASGSSALSGATASVLSGLSSAYSGVSSALGGATGTATSVTPANPTGYVMSGTGITGQIPVQKVIDHSRDHDNTYMLYLAQNNDRIIFKEGESGEQFSIKGAIPDSINDAMDVYTYINSLDKTTIQGGKYIVSKVDSISTATSPATSTAPIPGEYLFDIGGAGNFPVIKIVDVPKGNPPYNIYIAYYNIGEDSIIEVDIDTNYTKILRSRIYKRGDRNMTNITDYESYMNEFRKTNLQQGDIREHSIAIRKKDGTGYLRPPTFRIPVKGDYVIFGGEPVPVENLDVTKILIYWGFNYYCAQDGNNIRYVDLKGEEYRGGATRVGNLSSINTVDEFTKLTDLRNESSGFKIKNKDGKIYG